MEFHSMKHGRLLKKAWMLPLLVGTFIAVHGFVLYRVLSHAAWTFVLVFAVLVFLKHIGIFGSIYAFLRRRSRL